MKSSELIRTCDITQPVAELHSNEQLKARSHYLRGTIAEGIADQITGALPADDTLLTKFHGVYQQDDRDKRAERAKRKLEPNYQFMVRLRIPGGRLSAEQWLQLDDISQRYAERGLRITTRQTIQLHGVRKHHLRAMMQSVRDAGLDTIAACGDDSRGVICGNSPAQASISQEVFAIARATSNRLIPKTTAYKEVWYEEKVTPSDNEEPVYGPLYMPRKFKVGYVIPPDNDIDVFAQDLGLIAVIENNQLSGFNICVGGGMGQLDTREDSYPRLAETLGFIGPDEGPEVAEIVMGIQRDFGDRKDRHRARFKYTLDRLGNDWFLAELEKRRGKPLAPAKAITFSRNADRFGWQQDSQGQWMASLDITSGRIDGALQSKLQAFMQNFTGGVRLTTNQNMQLTHIDDCELEQVKWRLDDLGLSYLLTPELQQAHTITCVALPTCGLAMAEAERIAPDFLQQFNAVKARNNIADVPMTLRLSGCPNGCARPYIAEISLTGRAPGLYNVYLGGSFYGDRMAKLYASNLSVPKIMATLDELFSRFSAQRQADEYFGDFLVRKVL